MQIEIDSGSGFCFGVTTAIRKAEEELAAGKTLYCLGDIVHNGMECERLRQMGLITINRRTARNIRACEAEQHRNHRRHMPSRPPAATQDKAEARRKQ